MAKANKRHIMVMVKFNTDYIASRGPGIMGRKGEEKTYRWSEALAECIANETVEVVKETDVSKRQKATAGKKETS